LNRFLGKWYEVARYEHRFERGMTHVTAEYSLREDGKIKVVNKGVKDGKTKEIIGKAKQPDPINHPGKLKVSFFLWFYSDYYIMELDENYQYAVIGSSTDKYLWILSRTPELPYDTVIDLVNRLQQRGYDTEKLTWVQQ
jgi:lipocalin